MNDAGQHLLRDLAPQVLGAVVRRFGDFAASEDAVQEALIAATEQWPREGVPLDPRAWLIRVASRRRADQLRSEIARRRREAVVALEVESEEPERDDSLLLLFMCCHPALTRPTAIALTLRAVGGLTTAEIANAFLVPEATMAQRISRAKQSIKSSGIALSMPDPEERAARLDSVLHVLYLIFNEGYASSVGENLQRVDLSSEAIRLARMVQRALPDHVEATGLLALMLLTDARRRARSGPEDELIPLDEQDRSLWDRELIREGVELITTTLARGSVGPYQLQAAIAAVHDEAPSAEATDWTEILALYGLLRRMTDNPMVTLSMAVAAAMVHGPEAGLALVATLDDDPRIAGHYRLDAVRGHLQERAGHVAVAREHYRAAAAKTSSIPERDYLLSRALRLASQ